MKLDINGGKENSMMVKLYGNDFVHNERFGDVCMCDCHRVGLDGHYHCFGIVCCSEENYKYLRTPTEPVDRESAIRAFGEKGVLDEDLYSEMLMRKLNERQPKRKTKKNV